MKILSTNDGLSIFTPRKDLPLNTNYFRRNGALAMPSNDTNLFATKMASGEDMTAIPPAFSRVGKGIITQIAIAESIGFMLLIDGKKFLNKEHENITTTTVNSKIVGVGDNDGYIQPTFTFVTYNKSVEIYVTKPLAASNSSSHRFRLQHVILE